MENDDEDYYNPSFIIFESFIIFYADIVNGTGEENVSSATFHL